MFRKKISRKKTAEKAGQSKFVLYGTPQAVSPRDPVTDQKAEEERAAVLREYKKLLDDGVISREEYENKKRELRD